MSQPINSAKILPLSSPSNPCMCPFYVSWLNLPKNSLNKLFQWVYWIYSVEQGPKLRVTKAVMSKSYRFRSFAISIYMVLGHVKQWLLIWRSISFGFHRINNRGTSWSAVCCPLFVFKVRKEFLSEQLGVCTVARLLLLLILFISLGL